MRFSGLSFILLLAAMLLVAWLAVSQFTTPKSAGQDTMQQEMESGDAVKEAQDLVNQINSKMEQQGQEP